VRHLPVEVAAPAAGAAESAFVAPLFLNKSESHVRVEVHARGKSVAQARERVADEKLTVSCEKPLTQQRLHILVIGPQVAESGRATLAREVIGAVGGEFPADRPGFDRGPFKHKAFTQATLYRPLVYNVGRANIVGLLQDVEAEVRRAAGPAGARDRWQNDVVLLYYQGCDLVGKDRQRRLHTTRSLQYAAAAAEPHTVRIEELPQRPGVPLTLLNVVSADQAAFASDPLAASTLLLRYAWTEPAGADGFLAMLRTAVAQKPTLGGVVDLLHGEVVKLADKAGPPLDTLPNDVRDREFSVARP
jgi:hypothetical protein